jgi:D-galactarolactone cycloisomerase
MKILDVHAHRLESKIGRPFTDEGVTGWGECYGPAAVSRTIVEALLKKWVVGRDPFDLEVTWEDLYDRIKDYGPTGMTIAEISGIDIALWDIVGKACGKPIHKLIGGAFRSEIQAYATGLYFYGMDKVVEDAITDAETHIAQGFRAINQLAIEPIIQRKGIVVIQTGPDLGIEIDRAVIDRYRVEAYS